MDDSIVGVSVVVVVADRNLYRYPFVFVALPLILAPLGVALWASILTVTPAFSIILPDLCLFIAVGSAGS